MVPPPPPVVVETAESGRVPGVAEIIRAYRAGPVRCAGETVAASFRVDPFPEGMILPAAARMDSAATLAFEIAPDGRPIGIARLDGDGTRLGFAPQDDLEPALAAWRFAAGAPRRQCRVTFEAIDQSVAAASPDLLITYLSTRGSRLFRYVPQTISEAARKRLRPEGATCPAQPGARIWVWPEFLKIPQAEGTIGWTYLGFDVDRKGKATSVHLLGSSGNTLLDRKSIAALKQSVFVRPATGCLFNFFRAPAERMPPPAGPGPLSDYRDDKATCAVPRTTEKGGWESMAPLVFPDNFARRGIQGWAVVRYDVAPWGETGNVTVVDAQPASAFGIAARDIVRQSKRRPSAYGYTGCLETVRFVLPAPDEPAP